MRKHTQGPSPILSTLGGVVFTAFFVGSYSMFSGAWGPAEFYQQSYMQMVIMPFLACCAGWGGVLALRFTIRRPVGRVLPAMLLACTGTSLLVAATFLIVPTFTLAILLGLATLEIMLALLLLEHCEFCS